MVCVKKAGKERGEIFRELPRGECTGQRGQGYSPKRVRRAAGNELRAIQKVGKKIPVSGRRQ